MEKEGRGEEERGEEGREGKERKWKGREGKGHFYFEDQCMHINQ